MSWRGRKIVCSHTCGGRVVADSGELTLEPLPHPEARPCRHRHSPDCRRPTAQGPYPHRDLVRPAGLALIVVAAVALWPKPEAQDPNASTSTVGPARNVAPVDNAAPQNTPTNATPNQPDRRRQQRPAHGAAQGAVGPAGRPARGCRRLAAGLSPPQNRFCRRRGPPAHRPPAPMSARTSPCPGHRRRLGGV